jgi:hypothetical protein
MTSAAILSTSDIRRIPTAGDLPCVGVKREYQRSEIGVFSELRKTASVEVVTFKQLRERCSGLLRTPDGVRACRRNAAAQAVLCAALTAAIDTEDWRELWVLLSQIQRWLEVMDVPHGNSTWPFWMNRSDEARAGGSRGTALCVDDPEGIDVDSDAETSASAVVKAEDVILSMDQPMDDAAGEVAESHRPEIATAGSAVEPPARRRRIASLPPLQLCDFPVGCQVLTPRQNLDDGRTVSYCTVLSHKAGQLHVDIPGEKPFSLSLDYLRRTSEKHGKPMRKDQPTIDETSAVVSPTAADCMDKVCAAKAHRLKGEAASTLHPPTSASASVSSSASAMGAAVATPLPSAPPLPSEKARGKRKVADEPVDEAAGGDALFGKAAADGSLEDDDFAFVGEVVTNQLSDFPHARENCKLQRFADGKEALHCSNCFCCAWLSHQPGTFVSPQPH